MLICETSSTLPPFNGDPLWLEHLMQGIDTRELHW